MTTASRQGLQWLECSQLGRGWVMRRRAEETGLWHRHKDEADYRQNRVDLERCACTTCGAKVPAKVMFSYRKEALLEEQV